ncbi:HU family DNA-binding protein [Shewanella sp.]|uniref:HU family DNA-binding protein n=1 Tax=Shewanella sp. TaxID=50422 RepID=UPI003F3BB952
MAADLNASQTSTKPVVEQILQQIHIALSEGEKIFLTQFGTFELRYHVAKTGRNPQTGEAIDIDGYNQPSFKASTALKLHINS